jgi:hypothetical protein
MTCPYWSTARAVYRPGPRNLHVGLIDKPATVHAVAAWAGRVNQQRREPLDPSVQGHMVDLDAALREEFLEIPVGQSVAQAPLHSDQNDLRWEPEPDKR